MKKLNAEGQRLVDQLVGWLEANHEYYVDQNEMLEELFSMGGPSGRELNDGYNLTQVIQDTKDEIRSFEENWNEWGFEGIPIETYFE